jgi:hypothetical protein
MNEQAVKKTIESALQKFPHQPLAEAALHLLEVLGYASQRMLLTFPLDDRREPSRGFQADVP